MELIIRKREHKGVMIAIIEIEGALISGESAVLREKVKDLLNNELTRIVFNFQKTTMVDSTGIGSIIECMKMIKKHTDGEVKAAEVSGRLRTRFSLSTIPRDDLKIIKPEDPRVNKVFSMVHLNEIIDMYDDDEVAISDFT